MPVVKSIVYGMPIQKLVRIIVTRTLKRLLEFCKKEIGSFNMPNLTSNVLIGPYSPRIFLTASKETN
ncbi:hypothetical protein R84B8_01245 [Treponema sp. R8-4-B8]